MESVELKICKNLINSNFEGYKLSLDSLPIYKAQISNGVSDAALTEDQYSYHHAKIFGVHNHLIQDLWNSNNVYFVDKDWNITAASSDGTSVQCSDVVFTIPDSVDRQLVPGKYNVTVKFVGADLAVIGDGTGRVLVVDTQNRSSNSKWKVLMMKKFPDEERPSLLIDAVELSGDENHKLECLLVHVAESSPEEKDKYRSQFLTVLHWITFSSVDRKTWALERTRKLISRKPYSYAALGHDGESLVIAGEDEFIFTFDSLTPVVVPDKKDLENKDPRPPDHTWLQTKEDVTVQFTVPENPRPPDHTWLQTKEDVTVQFTVPENTTKANIYLTLSTDHIDFGIKNSAPLLKGPLHESVDVDGCTWTIDGQRVDLILSKTDEGMWPLVVKGETRGEMIINPEEAAAIHAQLARMTSDELNPDPEKQDKPYNTQELEECDMYPDDNFLLMRLNGESHKITHMSNLGSNQWLFNADLDNTKPPALCLRHDVDGLLWQPESLKTNESPWKHTATFNAFGYVQASKQTRRFTACPPDCSYAVITDTVRHCYLYRQSVSISTPLRNRKTGQNVSSVAKQQVISLEAVDDIIGLLAKNDKLFILTEKTLHMVKI